jgi:hypothetical protein
LWTASKAGTAKAKSTNMPTTPSVRDSEAPSKKILETPDLRSRIDQSVARS